MAALQRRSPGNAQNMQSIRSGISTNSRSLLPVVQPGATTKPVATPTNVATGSQASNLANKYNKAVNPTGTLSGEALNNAATTFLQKKTASLQPTQAELARGNFAQFGPGITADQYASQATSLSAIQNFSGQLTGQMNSFAAVGPAPKGAGSVTPESYKAFQQDIALEEMFGMLGSGSAANIRFAQSQTGAPIEKLIAAENKRLGTRQEANLDQPAFAYSPTDAQRLAGASTIREKAAALAGMGSGQQNLYNREGDFLFTSNYQTTIPVGTRGAGNKTYGLIQITPEQQKAEVAYRQELDTKALASKGISTAPLTQAFGTAIAQTGGKKVRLNNALPTTNTQAKPVTGLQSANNLSNLTTVALPKGDPGADYQKEFIAMTGVDIFNKPLNAPKIVKPIKDITGISQGFAPTESYSNFLGNLTQYGANPKSALAGTRYADLYSPISPGSTTLVLNSLGKSIPKALDINVKLRNR